MARWLAAVVMVALAAAAALAAGRWPLWALAGALGLVAVALAVARLPVVVALLVASFYFDDYLAVGTGIVTVGKLIGALALVAWFLAWALGGRRVVTDALFWPLAGLAAWLPLSLSAAYDLRVGAIVMLRYLTFFTLVFLIVQTVDGDRRTAVRLLDVAVAAAAVAALVGLVEFLSSGGRARGPLDDPNDYAFMLAVTVPAALYRARSAPTRSHRALAVLAVAVILTAIFATLSRSAFVGLAAVGVWALAARRVSPKWIAAVTCALLAIGLTWYLLQPDLIGTAVDQKRFIAQSNIDHRLLAWQVALDQAGGSPVLGVGPGNFEVRFHEYSLPPVPGQGPIAVHNAYLSVLAELGVPGLALFIAWLAMAWSRLRRRLPGDPDGDALQGALAGGFVVAVVGALFLTEQFYAPMWLLPALGATLVAGRRAADPQVDPRAEGLG